MTRPVFSIRLAPEVRAMLDQLAETLGIGPSQLAADLVTRTVKELTAHQVQLQDALVLIKDAGGHITASGPGQ